MTASPDGYYVYFAHKSGYFSMNFKFPPWQIARRDLRTGEEDVVSDAQGSAFRPQTSRDGTTMAYANRLDGSDATRLVVRATGTFGAPRPFAGGEVSFPLRAPVSLWTIIRFNWRTAGVLVLYRSKPDRVQPDVFAERLRMLL